MALNSIEAQWAAFKRNIGQFEGSLAQYDPEGSFVKREPTILFANATASVGEVEPFQLNFTLRRCQSEKDGPQIFFRVTDYVKGGRVFDGDGSMDSGFVALTTGVPSFIEQNLNVWEDGRIRGRTRTIVQYNEEGALRAMSVIRERPRNAPQIFTVLPPHPSTVSDEASTKDYLTTSAVLNADSYLGKWKVEGLLLGPNGLERTIHGMRTASLSSSGNELTETDETGRVSTRQLLPNGNLAPSPQSNQTDFIFFLSGGISIRTPLVLYTSETTISELGWLVNDHLYLKIRREYQGRDWIATHFIRETRLDT